ncbi:MAG TPA: HlyD family secretion protein [Stellaceae bacterium]|nr:HlyD family secretion protein [Stellaceae bacterium]
MPDGAIHDVVERVRAPRRIALRPLLLVVGPVAVVAGAVWLFLSGGRYVSTDNAYVQADLVQVSTQVSGMVKAVEVRDNEHVKAGQVLFRLDEEPFRFAVNDAAAQLASIRGDIESMRADLRAHEQEVKLAQVDVDFARREWQRQSDLFAQHVAPQSKMDQAQQGIDGAERRLSMAQQQAASVLAHFPDGVDEPTDTIPKVKAAQAKLDQAQWDLDHAVVHAPADGVTTNVPNLQAGHYLAAGTPAFGLVLDGTTYIDANPKETQLTWVRPGQPVAVTVDTYPGVTWDCAVASLAPASRSEFSLLPAQNTSGNWVKVVQRIPVRVACPAAPDKPILRAGMSAEIEIDTGHRRTLADLLEAVGL